MIFGKRRRFKIPQFPAQIPQLFKQLTREISFEDAAQLDREVDQQLDALRLEAKNNSNIDLQRAELLANKCHLLLASYQKRTSPQRALIVAAVSYFAIADDPVPEQDFSSGLEDDVKIMNYVLEELGLNKDYIV